jgi:hypothetical protein
MGEATKSRKEYEMKYVSGGKETEISPPSAPASQER